MVAGWSKSGGRNMLKKLDNFVEGPWDNKDEMRRLEYDLDENSIILDFGAYSGAWSSKMVEKYGCTAHCYEPVTGFYNRLVQNQNLKCYNFGVSDKTHELFINITKNELGSSIYAEDSRTKNREKIKILDVSEIMKNFKFIDVLKINVEGSEYEIIPRLVETGDISKIKHLQIQFHNFVENAEFKYKKCNNLLLSTHNLDFESMWHWSFWSPKE